MLNQYQEELIYPSLPELVEEPFYFVKPVADLRRNCFLLLILIFISALLIVAQNDQLAQAGYKLTEIKAQVAVLEKENQTLRIDIAKLKSTERIEEIATHELGLVLPDTNI